MICASLVGVCPIPPIPRVQLKFTEPRSLPSVKRDSDPSSTSSADRGRIFQVAHMSDVHVDRKYMVRRS